MKKATIIIIVLDVMAVVGLFLTYGPITYFRNLLITTAMTTMEHQYLAYIFYNQDTIDKVMSNNYIIEVDESINLDEIVIGDNAEKDSYDSIYEEQILKRDVDNDIYKIIPINEASYKGFLTVVYDPSKVKLAIPKQLGVKGGRVYQLCQENGGLVGINGGGFEDLDGWGNGSKPYGVIIKDGVKVWDNPQAGFTKGLIGFNYDNKMVLTTDDAEVAIKNGMRDAVEFGPFLIVNGKPASIKGDGGWGIAPRTAIAQRRDGIVLFLIIDGRRVGYSIGADMNDLIKIFLRYKAHNAANLDGGASTTMAVNGKLYNKPSAGGEKGGRSVSNAWIAIE